MGQRFTGSPKRTEVAAKKDIARKNPNMWGRVWGHRYTVHVYNVSSRLRNPNPILKPPARNPEPGTSS